MVRHPADTVVGDHHNGVVHVIVGAGEQGRIALVDPDRASEPLAVVTPDRLADAVRELEMREHPRWVWTETRRWYPRLLEAGVRVERCHDLRLCGAVLDRSTTTEAARATGRHPRPAWLPPGPAEAGSAGADAASTPVSSPHSALFDLDDFDDAASDPHADERARGFRREQEPHRARVGALGDQGQLAGELPGDCLDGDDGA